MSTPRFRRGLVLAGALAASVALVATAPAADKPVPCVGEEADPAGDAFVGFSGASTPIPADPNQDITSLFFRNDGKKVTANLRIANLTKTVNGAGNVYRLFWTYKDVAQFIDVEVTSGGNVTYTHGHFDPTPVGDGDTAGQFIEGPDGIISVTIPAGAGGKPGTPLDLIRWNASTSTGVLLLQSDVVPNEGEVGYKGDQCRDTVTPSPTPTSETRTPQNQVRAVSLKASKVDSARTASRKKALGLSVRASESLSAVTVTLKKGSRSLGSAKLTTLGTKPVKIKIKLKGKLKKGAYTLAASGKKSDGTTATASVKVAVKK